MIRYNVFRTNLANSDLCVARVQAKDCYTFDRLVDRMQQLGTSVSRQDIVSVLRLFEATVEVVCGEGSFINFDGFLRFRPNIGGIFNGEADSYTVDRNSVYVTASVAPAFNDRFQHNAQTEKTLPGLRQPIIYSVNDLATGSDNDSVTPGNIVSLNGEYLKFDPTNPEEYLRFVDDSDSSKVINIGHIQKRTDKQIVFLMPPTLFTRGYFELGNAMGTKQVRVNKSLVVEVAV